MPLPWVWATFPCTLSAQQNWFLTLYASTLNMKSACSSEMAVPTYKLHGVTNQKTTSVQSAPWEHNDDPASWDLIWEETIAKLSIRGGCQKSGAWYDWNSGNNSYVSASKQWTYRVIRRLVNALKPHWVQPITVTEPSLIPIQNIIFIRIPFRVIAPYRCMLYSRRFGNPHSLHPQGRVRTDFTLPKFIVQFHGST
jgi:hypothetical protein